MTGSCLSLAPILRCESLTRIETEVLIIPPALELLFSVSLVFIIWGRGSLERCGETSGRQGNHASKSDTPVQQAEGLVYFSIALIDLFAHIFPAMRNSLDIFRILDIFIGATSFIPIFCYVLFLFIFLRRNFLPSLPRRLQRITQFTLVFFIPSIVAADLLGSFIGISYTFLPSQTNPSTRLLAIGFANDTDHMLWTIFSRLALALLTIYQALVFCVVFYRLVKSFVNQRRIETSGDSDHSVVLIKGLGWLAIGLKVGAIETILGFALDGFGAPITRRILRFLSRACLIIGVVKGMDSREDFNVIEPSVPRSRGKRKSNLRLLISNPRHSTFRRMSEPLDPRLTEALASLGIERSNEKTYETIGNRNSQQFPFSRSPNGVAAPSPVLTYRLRPTSRVTVLMTPGTAPTLNLRFSALDMPNPNEIAELVEQEGQPQSQPLSRATTQLFTASHSRSRSQGTSHLLLHTGDVFDTRSSFFDTASLAPPSPMPMPDIPELTKPAMMRTKSWRYSDQMELGYARDSGISGNSATTFKGIQRLSPRRSVTMPAMIPQDSEELKRSRSSVNFYKQDNLPLEDSHGGELARDLSQKTYRPPKRNNYANQEPMPAYLSESEDESTRAHGKSKAPLQEVGWKASFMPSANRHYSLSSLASTSSLSRESGMSLEPPPNLSDLISQRSQATSPWISRRMPSSYRPVTAQEIDAYERASSRASSTILENDGSSGKARMSTDTAVSEGPQHANMHQADGADRSPRPNLIRLKTVGRAPRRETPTPSESPYAKDPAGFQQDLEVMPSWEVYSSSTPSTGTPSADSFRWKPVIRQDSYVLSRDDQHHIRNNVYERDEEGIYWVGNEARAG
ncbi:hypothetical protein NEOLEDRAFT_1145915 [Neolentinus lepideus HHB14362 ss-1]|uniref:Uncharacterized protein n=1 Tax=Neolentinus lepideus HHB14362 ss-1 TaxID=1314782 RepID=A0A165UKD9_9AGAM|nr:hypothetical protein NEOLEDRAFT_1145915 [Neolentinus lepideus HHB14362 ss-1]